MKKLKIIVSCSLILFTSCNQIPEGYKKYQTFDEYSLKGVNYSGKIIEPYVIVKMGKDTILVKIRNKFKFKLENYFNMDFSLKNHKYIHSGEYGENGELIMYIKKGIYWYNIKREQVDPKLYFTTKCDTVPYYTEKFIYNDTIMTYSYYMELNKKYSQSLQFETKNNIFWLSLNINFNVDEKNKFIQLKNQFVNYKTKFPFRNNSIRQEQYSHFYNKYNIKDSLFIYEFDEKKTYKLGCLNDARKLNSLGEFDPRLGVSILSELLQKEERCK